MVGKFSSLVIFISLLSNEELRLLHRSQNIYHFFKYEIFVIFTIHLILQEMLSFSWYLEKHSMVLALLNYSKTILSYDYFNKILCFRLEHRILCCFHCSHCCLFYTKLTIIINVRICFFVVKTITTCLFYDKETTECTFSLFFSRI